MSILKSLNLSSANRSALLTPDQVMRSKLIDYLTEQKALAEAENGGAPFNATKRISRSNDAGDRVRLDVPRHVRRGWFIDPAGKMFFQVRYGNKPLELAKGMNAVAVESVTELPAVIISIINAVQAGELDIPMKANMAARKALRKRS